MMTSFGALAIIGQDLTMGSLIATNMLSGRLLGPLNQLVSQWRTYSGYRQAVERLGEIFAIESERTESEVKLDKPKGYIEAHNLTFAYAEGLPPVCDNVTVSFEAGRIHALVGRNGSGKTTLLKMLQGLYRPSNGRVLLDGADISQFSRAELAQWMGYVPQESTLFAGTVRDNIINRYPNATDEEIVNAAKASGVHDFIIDLPDGYGADIGEAGRRLSGGQRQRIAIARALIGDPSILLLDEPSSSLDRHAEQELRDTLKELSKKLTVIMVTHSPILLAACDNLVALDKGKVALAGSAKDILPRLFGVAPKPDGPSGPPPSSPPPTQSPTDGKAAPLPRPAALGAKPPATPPVKLAPSPVPAKPKTAAEKALSPKPGVRPTAKATPKPTAKAVSKPSVKPVRKPAVPKPQVKPAPPVVEADKEATQIKPESPQAQEQTGQQAFAKIEPVKMAVPADSVDTDGVSKNGGVVKPDKPDEQAGKKAEDTPSKKPAIARTFIEESDDPYSDALQSLSTDREDPSRAQ